MDQVHTLPEGRTTQGQHQHKFPHTWIKFTHKLRAAKHKDSISTSFHTHVSSHTPTDGRKTQGQHQHKFPHTWIKFTHQLRAGKHKGSISTSFHTHGSSSHTN